MINLQLVSTHSRESIGAKRLLRAYIAAKMAMVSTHNSKTTLLRDLGPLCTAAGTLVLFWTSLQLQSKGKQRREAILLLAQYPLVVGWL